MTAFDARLRALLAAGRPGEVLDLYESVPPGTPVSVDARNIHGCALIMAGQAERAFALLKAIPDGRKTVEVWNNLCLAGLELEKFDELDSLIDAAMAAHPEEPALLTAKARCLSALGRLEEACDAARAAHDIQPTDETCCAAGLAAEQIGKYDEATGFYRGALALNPRHGAAANNLTELCWRLRRFAGLRALAEARMSSPTNRGQYARYFGAECRPWTEGTLAGRHLHVIADQGVGDQIMFTQFLPRLNAFEPAAVTVHLEPRLVPLFREGYRGGTGPAFEPLAARIGCNPADAKVPLSSLPHYLVTSERDFARTPFLVLDPGDAGICAGDGPPVFGLSWWSAGLASDARSLDVDELANALLATDARFLSLQYRPDDAGIGRLKARLGERLIVPQGLDVTNDFVGVARICLQLDGILTVPQALVHVAGAVGAPVGVLLPPASSWRYDSPDGRMLWYGDHVRLIEHDAAATLHGRIDSFIGRGTG